MLDRISGDEKNESCGPRGVADRATCCAAVDVTRTVVALPLLLLAIPGSAWGLSDPNTTLPADIPLDTPMQMLFVSSLFVLLTATLSAVLYAWDGVSRDRASGIASPPRAGHGPPGAGDGHRGQPSHGDHPPRFAARHGGGVHHSNPHRGVGSLGDSVVF